MWISLCSCDHAWNFVLSVNYLGRTPGTIAGSMPVVLLFVLVVGLEGFLGFLPFPEDPLVTFFFAAAALGFRLTGIVAC